MTTTDPFDTLPTELQHAYESLVDRSANPFGLDARLAELVAEEQAANRFLAHTASDIIRHRIPDAHTTTIVDTARPVTRTSTTHGNFTVELISEPVDDAQRHVAIDRNPTRVTIAQLTDAVLNAHAALENQPGDLADLIATALTRAATHLGDPAELTKHRSGSWEATHIDNLASMANPSLDADTPNQTVIDQITGDLTRIYQNLYTNHRADLITDLTNNGDLGLWTDHDINQEAHDTATAYLPDFIAPAVIRRHTNTLPTAHDWGDTWRIGRAHIHINPDCPPGQLHIHSNGGR